jgi:hypothetical protein
MHTRLPKGVVLFEAMVTKVLKKNVELVSYGGRLLVVASTVSHGTEDIPKLVNRHTATVIDDGERRSPAVHMHS